MDAARAPVSPSRGGTLRIALISLGALVLGLAIGAAAQEFHAPWAPRAIAVLEPVGAMWVNALRMVVLPLVLANLVLAIGGVPRGRGLGRMTLLSFSSFVGLLLLGFALTLLVVPPLIRAIRLDPTTFSTFRNAASAGAPVTAGVRGLSQILVALVPSNPFRAAADGELLPLLVFTIPFAFAVTRIAEGPRTALLEMTRAVRDAGGILLSWLLAITPLGVFALGFVLAARTGMTSMSALAWFVAMICGLLLAYTLIQYPLAVLVGGISPGRFARGVLPAQVVAASTRSSLAALPALLQGAEEGAALPREVYGFTLPLAVSVFKLNRSITSLARMLFLAHLYGITLEPAQIAAFILTVLLISFGTAGVPATVGGLNTLPAYVAVGIPAQGVILLGALDTIPDVFETILNVTGNMTATTWVARFRGARPAQVEAVSRAS